MPKRLTDQKAMREFYEANRNDPQAMIRVRVHVATIEARIGFDKRIEVRLPAAAGY